MAVRLHGESLTRNIGASPNVAEESFLSQILEGEVPEKYYLSARACLGILRRAEKRGKELPPELKAALEAQASCGCVPESPGGGKGALVSRERSLTLAANTNDQVLFTGNCLTPWDCQAKRIYKQDGVFPCLQSTESNGEKPGSVYVPDKARSLTARNDGSPCVDRGPEIIAAGFKAGAGADAGGLGYQVEQMPTLTSAESGTQRPTVAVYDMTHADEVMRPVEGGKCQTLNARMGTGGNQVPVISYAIAGNIIGREDKNGGHHMGLNKDVSFTLNTVDRHAVYAMQRSDKFQKSQVSHTLAARDYKSPTDLVQSYTAGSYAGYRRTEQSGTLKESGGDIGGGSESIICQKAVRRLTPTECERLMGLEDGYTLIDDKTCSDTARYKALGNGMAQPCASWIIKRIVEVTA